MFRISTALLRLHLIPLPFLPSAYTGLCRASSEAGRADKGYDAESNHEYAQDVLGARTAIPVRAASRPKIEMRGKRRRKQRKEFDQKGYDSHRPKVETVNSVEKRTMGSHVLAHNTSSLCCNSRRLESLFLLLIKDFYKAVGKKNTYMCKTPDYLWVNTMKYQNTLATLAKLVVQQKRPFSVWEYTYCVYGVMDKRYLNHAQMDISRLFKMGLLHRHKEKFEGRRRYLYDLTSKGRKYLQWLKSDLTSQKDKTNTEDKKDDSSFDHFHRFVSDMCRLDEFNSAIERAGRVWETEKPTLRFLENGGVERLTDREYNKFKIARSVLNNAGMADGPLRDDVALYFSRNSWSKM